MASLGQSKNKVILAHVGSAWACDVQFILQREAQSGKVWLPARGVFLEETHVVTTARVLLHEAALPLSSDDLKLVRDEVLSITLSDVWRVSACLGFLGVCSVALHCFSFMYRC
jgi:hypothetical protein